MKLSEKIIKLRKENGLSQEEFGNKINVSRQAVSKWENEEAKPDIDKIQEIVKEFNVSFEYLLNNEVENIEDTTSDTTLKNKKHKMNTVLKIFLTLLLIYLLICLYKFIAFYKFYLTANSFEEENYIIRNRQVSHQNYGRQNSDIDTYVLEKKVGYKYILEIYDFTDLNPREDKGVPITINYIDYGSGLSYSLNSDITTGKYIFNDHSVNVNPEELLEIMKESNINPSYRTMGSIPSGFKEIFLASINPQYYYVDIFNRQYRKFYHFNNQRTIVQLSVEGLVEYITYTDDSSSHHYSFSYDFEQEHFNNFVEPLEQYKDKIILEE